MAPEINISLDQSEGSLLSDDFLDTPDDLDINVDDIETPDETDSLEFLGNGNDLEWEGNGVGPCPAPACVSRACLLASPGLMTLGAASAGTHGVWCPHQCGDSAVTWIEVQMSPTHGVAGGGGRPEETTHP